MMGASKDLLSLVDQYRISDVVVAITGEVQGSTFQTLLDAQERGIEVTRMPIVYEEITQRVPIHHLESDWVIRSFVDQLRVFGHLPGLQALAGHRRRHFWAWLSCCVLRHSLRWRSCSTAVRRCCTHRTVWVEAVSRSRFSSFARCTRTRRRTVPISRPPRMTSASRRSANSCAITHLDEFPQFWNVLRGSMSLVGPRAERAMLVAEFQQQIPFYRARLLVKPGLTGWAQINYGYVETVRETEVKLEYDLYYIKHRSPAMDIRIILRTIGVVFGRKGR